jgi:phage tail sheath gpL-like
MSNVLYDKGRESFLKGEISWSGDNIKTVLTRDVPDTANDQFLSDLASTVATSANLTTKTTTNGVADADDVTFGSVAAGAAISYIVVYQDTGSAATSRLIAAIDTATGLPVTPNGGDITVQWDAGANKIFKL